MSHPAPLELDLEPGDDGGIDLPARLLRPAGFERGMSIRIYIEDKNAFVLRYLGFDNATSIPGWELAERGLANHSSVHLRVELETRTEEELDAEADEALKRLPPKSEEEISAESVEDVRAYHNERPWQ